MSDDIRAVDVTRLFLQMHPASISQSFLEYSGNQSESSGTDHQGPTSQHEIGSPSHQPTTLLTDGTLSWVLSVVSFLHTFTFTQTYKYLCYVDEEYVRL